jgi:hypothetical protein
MTKTDTWQTRPLVREGAPKRQDSNFEGGKKCWSNVQDLGLTPRHTDWLTVSRNVTLTLFFLCGPCLNVTSLTVSCWRQQVSEWASEPPGFSCERQVSEVLWHRDSSVTRSKGKISYWKPLPISGQWRRDRALVCVFMRACVRSSEKKKRFWEVKLVNLSY